MRRDSYYAICDGVTNRNIVNQCHLKLRLSQYNRAAAELKRQQVLSALLFAADMVCGWAGHVPSKQKNVGTPTRLKNNQVKVESKASDRGRATDYSVEPMIRSVTVLLVMLHRTQAGRWPTG